MSVKKILKYFRNNKNSTILHKTYETSKLEDDIFTKLLLILKLARPRTWLFAIISYLFAYQNTNHIIPWKIFFGILIFSFGTAATNMINALTDISEDITNNPIRIPWMSRIGSRKFLEATILSYALVLILSVPFGLQFMIIIIIAVFDSVFYSLSPLRFKKRPVIALIAFSGAIGLPFLAGLIAIHQFDLFNPWFILLTVFMFSYGTVKNIPDYQGDKKAGLKTSATIFRSRNLATFVGLILLLIPYGMVTYFVYTSALDSLYLLNMPLISIPVIWAYKNLKTSQIETQEKLHTIGFMYAICFPLFNMILKYRSIGAIFIAISSLTLIFFITGLNIDSRIKK